MSGPFGSSQFMYATDAFAEGSSLRFEDGDSAYLSWTPASAGNRKTWTWSGWVKRGNGGENFLFAAQAPINNLSFLYFTSSDKLQFWTYQDGVGTVSQLETAMLFRDHSAWYNIVVVLDTTESTASNRVKIFVNNEQQTLTGTYFGTQNYDANINTTTTHYIGKHATSGTYLDGYLANVTFIDGTALDPTSFGEYDDTLWKPKSDTDIQSLTFGTNGFYLPFDQTTEAEGFSTVTYTGNGGQQSIEGVGFEPDLVWIKARNFAGHHVLVDSVRGTFSANRYGRLFSNTTAAEDVSSSDTVTSLDADGFGVNSAGSGSYVNDAGDSYVAWCWDAGTGSAASNTDGSITSSVKANTTKGFSVVSHTGNGSNATIGHGLGVAPSMILYKRRDSTGDWNVYHASLGKDTNIILNTTGASYSSTTWNNTAPTSSVYSIVAGANTNTATYIAYCFAEVSGYSSIGSYTGTGASGNSVTTGFKPAFVMIKNADNATNSWAIFDNTRDTTNPRELNLFPNDSLAESDYGGEIEFTSTGFTVNSTNNFTNQSGNNIIYMAFADTRDATFFGDTSGNGNNWTPNALNNTDVVPDSPVTNFATLNSVGRQYGQGYVATFSQGNLQAATGGNSTSIWGTMAIHPNDTQGYYWEFICYSMDTARTYAGLVDPSGGSNTSNNASYEFFDKAILSRGGYYYGGQEINGSGATLYTAYAQGDIVSVAYKDGKIWFAVNGTYMNSGDPAAGTGFLTSPTASSIDTTKTWIPYFGYNSSFRANFGQDSSFAGVETPQGNTDDNGQGDFYYAPPSGFLALNRNNLPSPDILDPADYFNTVLYSGDGATDRDITGYDFQPDFLWHKARNKVYNHYLFDVVRGNSSLLRSNTTQAENTGTTGFNNFISNGFNVDQVSGWEMNESGSTYANWGWLAGGTAVSNTDGSITSQVSANQDAGFSIVKYTGNQTSGATIGHGLNSAPEITFHKNLDTARNWESYFVNPSDGSYDYIYLNMTNGKGDMSISAPTASVITLSGSQDSNRNGDEHIAYCFHSVEGYSKFGSYTGNGSADGTYVHLGFRASWIMFKRTDSTSTWIIQDAERNQYNVVDKWLDASGSTAEGTLGFLDFTANGFKHRYTSGTWNTSGGSYIFIAFAEAPFRNANAR